MLASKLLNIPFCPSSSFSAEGAFPYGGHTPLLLSPQECGCYLTSSPLLCPFFFLPYYMFTWGAFLSFWCLSSSTSVYQVLCKNCSMCRCILDAFAKRDRLYVLLLLHHLEIPMVVIVWSFKINIYVFFVCTGSLLLCIGFLWLWQVRAVLHCGSRASHCSDFSCCRAQVLGTGASAFGTPGV